VQFREAKGAGQKYGEINCRVEPGERERDTFKYDRYDRTYEPGKKPCQHYQPGRPVRQPDAGQLKAENESHQPDEKPEKIPSNE
jgi:hypothetical protein